MTPNGVVLTTDGAVLTTDGFIFAKGDVESVVVNVVVSCFVNAAVALLIYCAIFFFNGPTAFVLNISNIASAACRMVAAK